MTTNLLETTLRRILHQIAIVPTMIMYRTSRAKAGRRTTTDRPRRISWCSGTPSTGSKRPRPAKQLKPPRHPCDRRSSRIQQSRSRQLVVDPPCASRRSRSTASRRDDTRSPQIRLGRRRRPVVGRKGDVDGTSPRCFQVRLFKRRSPRGLALLRKHRRRRPP